VLVGPAASALIDRAEGWDADLIVVGSQGRSAIGRLVLGSVSKQVAIESSRSVLVSRHVVERGDAPLRIIIGIDGSAHAAAAAKVIVGRSWPDRTMVRVVAVDDTVRPTGTAKLVPRAAAWVSESNAAHLQNLRDMVESTAETLRRAGLQVSTEVKQGDAQRLLCTEAASWGADCIFVGSRGLGSAVERLRLGSVSTALVTSAPCSVEIVRTRLERR
jgi:nucleotide-binding universal stress UspA family protein